MSKSLRKKAHQIKTSKIQLSILKRALFLFFENKDYQAMCRDCQSELIELVDQITIETERGALA